MEFQIGDRVAALGSVTSGIVTQPGDTGTVLQVIGDNIEVDWDTYKFLEKENSTGSFIFWAGADELELKERRH